MRIEFGVLRGLEVQNLDCLYLKKDKSSVKQYINDVRMTCPTILNHKYFVQRPR